jgi:hypothetical protein
MKRAIVIGFLAVAGCDEPQRDEVQGGPELGTDGGSGESETGSAAGDEEVAHRISLPFTLSACEQLAWDLVPVCESVYDGEEFGEAWKCTRKALQEANPLSDFCEADDDACFMCWNGALGEVHTSAVELIEDKAGDRAEEPDVCGRWLSRRDEYGCAAFGF